MSDDDARAIMERLDKIDRQIETLRRDAIRGEMLTRGELMAIEKVKTPDTINARAEERGIPERTIGGDRRTSPKQPLRFSLSEWMAGREMDTRTVKHRASPKG